MSQAPYSDPFVQTKRERTLLSLYGYVPGRTVLLVAVGSLLCAYVAAVLFTPILRGLDTYISFSHLYIWTTALQAGDAISTWTPLDANGFGSPVPFFYHKLFNLVGATLALASGDIVIGYRLAVLVFSALMLYGVYLCAGRFGADRLSRLVIAAASLCTPYAIAKLVAGGSVAEYSASALIPLILALAIDFYTGKSARWRGAPLFVLMTLLALAHVLIFVAAEGLLVVLALYLIVTSSANRWPLLFAVAGSLAMFIALMYVPFNYWAAYFCPAQARIFGRPADNLLALGTVLWLSPRSAFGWPVFALMIGMVACLRQPRQARTSLAFGLGVVVMFLILLTTRLSRPLWQISDQLDFVQFPWRLLAVATPICLVALGGMIEQLSPAPKRRVQLGMLALALGNAACTLYLYERTFPTIPLAQLRHEVPTTSIIGPDAGGEYFPAAFQPQLATLKVWLVPAPSVLPARRPLLEASGCSYGDITRPAYFDQLQISATCADGGRLRVNQFSTPFLDSVAVDDHGTAVLPLANSQFIEFALPAGHWSVSVRKRTYIELLTMAWRARLGTR
jgi:hypothetical protein